MNIFISYELSKKIYKMAYLNYLSIKQCYNYITKNIIIIV